MKKVTILYSAPSLFYPFFLNFFKFCEGGIAQKILEGSPPLPLPLNTPLHCTFFIFIYSHISNSLVVFI